MRTYTLKIVINVIIIINTEDLLKPMKKGQIKNKIF